MDYFIRKLIDSFGIFFRTIKAFFSRRIMGVAARFKQLTNFSRNATKVANASFQGAAAAVKKPTKREDYIETQRLFISKSFIIYLIIGIVLVGIFCYFVVWPFILSHFLTAKFYVRDDRVEEWTGKVIVYSDKSKKKPLYSGKLENGLLQGQGKEYDEEGLLEFEGTFVDGVRTGPGKSYKAGVLVYEGSFDQGKYQGSGTLYEDGLPLYQGRFEEGVYEGSGKLFSEGVVIYEGQFHEGVYEGSGTTYQDGKPVYKGTFSAGVPEGSGTLYEDGVKRYEGGFSEGQFNGDGKLFFPDGTLNYKGGFAGGVYDGEGTEYREDGSVAYTGGYAGGKPAGAGTVTLENGDKIESTFTDGVGDGMIKWYKNGRLWYEGGAVDLTPDGFGAIYAESGKIVYQGSMDRGCIDGPWLLTLTADELREAFAQAAVTETDRNGGGFLMTNEDLNLMVLCTYRSDEGESSAYRVWIFPIADDINAQLLPWSTREEAEDWAVTDREGFSHLRRIRGGIFSPGGGAEGDWSQSVAYFESYNQSLVSLEEDAVPFGIVWAVVGSTDVPVLPTVDEAISEAQEKLEQLLEELDKVTAEREPENGEQSGGEQPGGEQPGGEQPGGEQPGGEQPGGEQPGGEQSGNDPSGGETPGESPGADVEALLESVKDMDQATTLMGALINAYAYGQAITSLEAARPLRASILEEQKALRDKGLSTDETVDQLQNSLDTIDHQIYQYNVMLKQADITVETLTGKSVEGLDLSDVLLAVNTGSVNVDLLYADALQYAKDLAADRYEVDPAEILVDVKVKLLDLMIGYDNIEQGRSALERNLEALERITDSYSRGEVEKADLYTAQCAVNDTVASLFQTIAAYTRTFNDLNDLSGGWMAREFNWYPEPFAPLKEASIAKAKEEAEKAAGNPAGEEGNTEDEKEGETEGETENETENGESSGQTDGNTGEQENDSIE